MEIKAFNKGDIVFHEGDRDRDYMYEIVRGSVKAFADYGKESQVLLSELGAGMIFGEMALLEKAGRTATIEVQEDGTELLCVDEASLSDYLEEPEKFKKALAHIGHLIKARSDDYIEACKTVYEIKNAGKQKSGGLLDRIKKLVGVSGKNEKPQPVSVERARLDSARVIMNDIDDALTEGDSFERGYDMGTVIFREGEMGDCMYYVTRGVVGIYSAYGTPNERQVARLTPGMVFGEIGFLEKIPRTATAVVIEGAGAVRVVTDKYLTEVLPILATSTLKYLSARLRAVTNDYLLACEAVSCLEAADKGQGEPDEDMQKRIDEYVNFAKAFI